MKKLILLMFVLAMFGLVFADTVTVGTGTATTSYLPLYGLYGYNYTQQIYTQAQIGVVGNITKIRFYYVSGTITNSKDWIIYMGHTTKTTFATTTDWEPLANLTQVFAGDVSSLVPLANNWMEITLTTPFAYNNTSNLIVAVDENTVSYASMSWGAFTSGTNTGIYYYSDTINPDPATPPTATSRTASIDRIQFVFPNTVAPLAPTLVSPVNGGWSFTDGKLYWTPTAGGSDANTYDVYFGTSATPPQVSDNQVATNYTPTLAAGTTYYWYVVATNEHGDSPATATWSFKTPTTTQLAESFEVAVPPAGWANGTTGSWLRSTSYYKHGVASAYKSGSTTVQYILSTPRVTITGASILDFWAAGSSTTTAALQVVYSPDRVTWTQLGANITYAATYTFYRQIIDLSSLAGNNYYLGFRTATVGTGSSYIDMVFGPEITPEAPGAPVLSTPADLAINVNEYAAFTWTAPITGGIPTGYNLYLDTVAGSTLYASNVTSPYTLTTPLAYNTPYYWTVVATNGAGAGPAATVRSFTTRANPIISTFPWEVNFGTLTADWPVLNWTQLTGLYGTTPIVGTQWYQDDFVNVTAPLNKSAKINIYGTTRNGWLVTPPVAIPATGYELKFDIALTDWNGTVPPVAGEQADDKFIVLVSNNPMMTGATILREWNNTGSAYVFDSVSNTGENHIINLNSYVGTYYFAFYGESTVSLGDNDFFVDNVTVRETPVAAIFNLTPNVTSWDFGMVPENIAATKEFTISNTGGAPLTITSVTATGTYYSISVPPALMTIPVGGSTNFTVQYLPTVAGGPYTGSLNIVFSRETRTVALTGSAYTPATLPVTEGFEAGFGNFIVANGTQTNQWYAGTATFNTGAQSAYISNDAGVTNAYDVAATSVAHMYQDVLFTPGADQYNLSFAWKGYGESSSYDYLQVFLVDTATTPVAGTRLTAGQIGVNYNLQSTWQTASLVIPNTNAGQVKRLVFSWWNDNSLGTQPPIAVDDISLTANMPSPPDPVTLNSPANDATNLPVGGFNLTWTPAVTGGVPTSYGVYMSQIVDNIYADYYWETTNLFFNPATAATTPVTFAYDAVWYWTVEAINTLGSAVVEPARRFTIEAAPTVITVFPWVENFDAAAALPDDWSTADVDGGGTFWQTTTVYSHSAPNAFRHAYSTATPDPGQNGWLITPAVAVPVGNYYLSWWNYNNYPSWMVYNGVKVNTVSDPAAPGWVEIWSQVTAASAWSQAVVNISAYAGQTVYFAFNYQGYDGDDWYVDDVSVYELLVDTFGPVITHLPVINTPREDINYLVYADIADDPTWNNPIGGANMYYSIDGGTNWSTAIPMALDVAPGYYAYIPAQPLGTTVTYKIEAWDSLNNMTTTSNYAFGVNDPTWVWYDQGGTTYLGYTTVAFGPAVLFENPFFGTGNAMQLLATDGSSYYGNTANLQIYTPDALDNLVPYFTTPIPVTFGVQAYDVFDLSTYNVQITTPYFLVAYLDIPMGNYILFDSTYDYGTTYVYQGTTLYTLSNSGSWAIGANVQTGIALGIDAPVVTIALDNGSVVLSWSAITGASSYIVYGSNDPYAADPWSLVATVSTLSYTYMGTEDYKFFKVTASSDAPPAGRYITSGNRVEREVAPAITAPLSRTSMTTMKVRELPHRTK